MLPRHLDVERCHGNELTDTWSPGRRVPHPEPLVRIVTASMLEPPACPAFVMKKDGQGFFVTGIVA